MEIKGVSIQNEENYYKILSVIRNNKNVTVKEVKALKSYLKGEKNMKARKNVLLENENNTNKVFSGIRGLLYKEDYYFFS